MNPTRLSQIAEWCGGTLIQGTPSDIVAILSTDSRSLKGGEVFLALKGDNFDGHDFVTDAAEKGVAAMILSNLKLESETYEGGIIHVRNSLIALQMLALRYRRSLEDLFAVGVTGSNGKTSTKDFLNAVLGQGFSVCANRGNFNNHIGLPLTILESDSSHQVGVWEMGMNHPGEIEVLAEIAGPNAAVISNIGTAHIEFMKSREAIAEEKGMLAEAIPPDGFVVLNASDDFTDSIRGRCRGRVITAGIGCGDVQATELSMTKNGIRFRLSRAGSSTAAEIPVPGEHMVMNALLAAAVGIELGLSLDAIAEGLRGAKLTGGRLQRREAGGLNLLDDSYNANPDSMRAAIETLCGLESEGRRVAVLGLMGELGEAEEAEHRALGEFVAGKNVNLLLTVGEKGALIAEGATGAGGGSLEVESASDHATAADFLKKWAKPEDLVLVKGSRSAAMEKVIEGLEA